MTLWEMLEVHRISISYSVRTYIPNYGASIFVLFKFWNRVGVFKCLGLGKSTFVLLLPKICLYLSKILNKNIMTIPINYNYNF